MEDTKRSKHISLPTYVTTHDAFRHLVKNFTILWNRFVEPRPVTIFGHLPPEEELPSNFSFMSMGSAKLAWSDQMLEFAKIIGNDLFIILHEDFYMIEPARLDILYDLEDYAREHPEVTRISLQCIDDGYNNFAKPYDKTKGGLQLYRLDDDFQYLCSFEAGIMRRDLITHFMRPGERTATAEVEISYRMRGKNQICLVTDERALVYRDAMIRGEERIRFIENELWLLTPDGWQNKHIRI